MDEILVERHPVSGDVAKRERYIKLSLQAQAEDMDHGASSL